MFSRIKQWLTRHDDTPVISTDCEFTPKPSPTIIRFRWVIYTTKHKRGPAKGRRRYQFTHGRNRYVRPA